MDFRILGRLEVDSEDGNAVVLTPLARQALCALVLHTETLLQPDQLGDLLWEPDGTNRAGHVKTLISEVRRALTVDRVPYGYGGYRLRLNPADTVDLWEFRDLIERARQARALGARRQAAGLYGRGLALWTDPPLSDLPTTSTMSVVTTGLLAERRDAREEFAAVQLQLGGHQLLIPRLREWAAQDPFNERTWEQLLLALYRSGRKAEALHQWEQVRRTLRHEVKAEPGPELRAMWERIKADDPKLRVPATADSEPDPASIDVSTPNVARIYDYLLGGKDNFAADRRVGNQLIEGSPKIVGLAKANRRFLLRAVGFLAAERGIRQFLDVGSGLPTQVNVHEVAAESRVVYVDHDPVVSAHGRSLLQDDPQAAFLEADLRDPEELLARVRRLGLLDFTEPIGLLLIAVLHFVPDSDRPHELVARLLDALPSGSYLALTHGAPAEDEHFRELSRTAFKSTTSDLWVRPYESIKAFFTGLELVPPGLVPVSAWRPDHPAASGSSQLFGGVARKT